MVADILLAAGVQAARHRGLRRRAARLRALRAAAVGAHRAGPPDRRPFDPAKYQRLLASSQARQSGLLVALEQYFRSEVPKQKLFEQVTSGLYVTDAELWRAWQDANDSAAVSFVAFRPPPSAGGFERRATSELRAVLRRAQGRVRPARRARRSACCTSRALVTAGRQRRGARAHRRAARGDRRRREVRGRREARVGRHRLGGAGRRVSARAPAGGFVPEFEKAALRAEAGRAVAAGADASSAITSSSVDSRTGDTLALRHILLRVAAERFVGGDGGPLGRPAGAKIAASSEQPGASSTRRRRTLGAHALPRDGDRGRAAQHDGKYVPSVSAWAFGGAQVGETSDLFDARGRLLHRAPRFAVGGRQDASTR